MKEKLLEENLNKSFYRKDIDGLRGISVASVILYHISKSILPGGFVGVDIFFVISGYLVTKIITKQLDEDNFSFTDFYGRRLKRIFPACVVCVFLTLLYSYFIMWNPKELVSISQSSIASIFSLANYYNLFYISSGYFSPDTSRYPLLHLWSLSVEEQFYFVFPIMIFLLYKYMKRATSTIILICILISLILAESIYKLNPSLSYYTLYCRMGEILIGSFLNFLAPLENYYYNEIISMVGLVLTTGSIYFFNEKIVFPGFNSIFPCFGASFLIFSGVKQNTIVKKILSFNLFVNLGLVSYSAYLYHWPIIALSKVMEMTYSYFNIFNSLLLGFVCTLLSYYFIETPFRNSRMNKTRSFIIIYVIPSLFVIILSLFVYQSSIKNVDIKLTAIQTNQSIEQNGFNDFMPPSYFNISQFLWSEEDVSFSFLFFFIFIFSFSLLECRCAQKKIYRYVFLLMNGITRFTMILIN